MRPGLLLLVLLLITPVEAFYYGKEIHVDCLPKK